MSERPVFGASTWERKAIAGLKAVLVACAVLVAIWAALLMVLLRCPVEIPTYKVIPTDVHGKLEYCIADKVIGRTVHWAVAPGAPCGQSKTELTAKATRLEQQAAEQAQACSARIMQNPQQLLAERLKQLSQ